MTGQINLSQTVPHTCVHVHACVHARTHTHVDWKICIGYVHSSHIYLIEQRLWQMSKKAVICFSTASISYWFLFKKPGLYVTSVLNSFVITGVFLTLSFACSFSLRFSNISCCFLASSCCCSMRNDINFTYRLLFLMHCFSLLANTSKWRYINKILVFKVTQQCMANDSNCTLIAIAYFTLFLNF